MRPRRTLLFPQLFVAIVTVALIEAEAVAHLLAGERVRTSTVVAAFTTAAGIVLLPLLLGGLAVTALGSTRALRRFRLGARAFVAGGPGRRELVGVAAVVYAVAFGEALVWSTIVIRHLARGARVELAALEGAIVTAASIGAFAIAACVAVHLLAPVVRWARARAPRAAAALRGWTAPLLVTAVAVVVVRTLFPPEIADPIGAVLASAGVATVTPVRRWLADRLSGRRGVALVAFTLVFALSGYVRLTHLPGRARLAVLHGTVVGAVTLAVVHRATDRDGDGYSPVLGGGDCDDHDRAVHPGAHDVPGNGRDEDCSGADARPFLDVARDDAAARDAASIARPNIVIVHLDAVRPDHVGFAGYARPTTPELDRFRAGATWFTHAYAPGPSTRASMTAMLTGIDAARAAPARDDGSRFALRTDVRTVAERLGEVGYDRAGVTFPYVLESIRGIEKGFRTWESAWGSDEEHLNGTHGALTTEVALARLERLGRDGAGDGGSAQPFFLYVHYLCAHQPYSGDPARAFGPTVVDLYDNALATCDHEMGRLLRALDQRADRDRTALVVLSDHGELLGEHGFVGHGTELYEPAVRAVLLARIPGIERFQVDAPVALIDLAPTILALAGAPRRLGEGGEPGGEGRSLLAVARAPSEASLRERPIFLEENGWASGLHFQSRAVIQGHFKYVRDVATGIEQLFDLEADPGELDNVRRSQPAERARLAEELEAWSAYVTGG